MITLSIQTDKREDMINITRSVQNLVTEQGWKNGAALVYCPHTTGAITINEGADPDVVRDIVTNMRKTFPHHGDYHHAEGNSDSHLKTSTFGCSELVIVEDGHIQLGTWQRIFFCEWDGPRNRKIWVQWLQG